MRPLKLEVVKALTPSKNFEYYCCRRALNFALFNKTGTLPIIKYLVEQCEANTQASSKDRALEFVLEEYLDAQRENSQLEIVNYLL